MLNWFFLLFLRYLQEIVSQNFLVNYFLCENWEDNLLTRFSWTYLNFFLYSSFPTATPYHINCQTRQGKVIPYHSLIRLRHRKGKCALTLTYVEYYVYTKSHTHIARYLNVVQRDVLHRFFLNFLLSWNVRSRNNRQQLLSCNTNSTLRYNFLGN